MIQGPAVRMQQDWNHIMSQPLQASEVWAEGSDQFATLQEADGLRLMVGPRLNSPALLSGIPRVLGGGSMLFTVRNKKHEVAFSGQRDVLRHSTFYNSQNQSNMRYVPTERSLVQCPPCDACCWCACCDCCSNQYTIEAPVGIKIGHISQGFGCCFHRYTITDEHDQEVFKFKKWNCCACCACCENSSVDISDAKDGNDVAIIQNCSRHNAELEFKKQMDGKSKALLLAAMLVIYSFFYNPIETHRKRRLENEIDSMLIDKRVMLTGGVAPPTQMPQMQTQSINQVAPY